PDAQRDVAILVVDDDDDEAATPAVVDELEDGAVLRVRITGMEPGERGSIRQCVETGPEFVGCRNMFPVQADGDGAALVQYQVVQGSCDPNAACILVVDDPAGRFGYARTVFGAPARPAPAVVLTPPGPYDAGGAITVGITGVVPGGRVDVAVCTPGCDQFVTTTADPEGQAETEVHAPADCSDGCTLFVIGGGGAAARISFGLTSPPGADYETRQLALGLGIALMLLTLAFYVFRRTDWHPPSEADTPALDAANL
ncbi:MAG: hypothetical protein ABWZ15_06115, partial [Acidimicrobiia bacterium]